MAINGTPGADTLGGTSGDDVINGLAGNDKLSGLGGADQIDGGDGNDILNGGDGDDILTGGKGADNLVGGAGHDTAVFLNTSIAAASTGPTPIGSWSGALLTLATGGLDGTDILNQVESLNFNGQTFAVTGYNRGETYNVVANLGADSAVTDQDSSISGNVLANDYDVDSQLTVTGVRVVSEKPPAMPSDDPKAQDGKPANFKIAGHYGDLILNADGSYSYQAFGKGSGVEHFQYSVTDGGVTRWVNLDINVTHVNHAPDTENQSATGSEDSTISGQVYAKDRDGDDLTFSVTGPGPAHGSLDFHSDGTYSYTPDADFNGSDGFDFLVSDGQGGTATAHVDLQITPENDAPVIDEDIPVATSGGPAAFNLTTEGVISFDVIGHVASNGDPQGGIQYGDGDATREQLAALGISGSYLDGIGNFNGATIIQVNLGTYPPGWSAAEIDFNFDTTPGSNDQVLVTFGGSIVVDYAHYGLGNDWEDGIAANGVVNASFQIVVLDFAGDNFVSTLTHYNAHLKLSGDEFFTPGFPIFITGPGGGGSLAPVEDTPFNGQFHAHDVDGDVLTFSLVEGHGPAHGSVTISSDGHFVYTPDADYSGSDTFQYQVDDGHGGTDTATYSFDVAAVNDAPVASDGSAGGAEDSVISGQASASDVDGDSLTYSVVSGPTHGSLTFHSDGSYSFTPDANYHGPDSFTYQVDDGHGGTDTATISLDVNPPVNDVPTASGGVNSTDEDVAVSGQVYGGDADDDKLGFHVVSGPSHGSLVLHIDGSYTYTPEANYHGSDSFTFVANDGEADSDPATVELTVNSVNDAPEPDNAGFEGLENQAISGALSATDVDGDTLVYTLGVAKAPAGAGAGSLPGVEHGTLDFHSDGTFTYTPDHGFFGTDSFGYTVDDGHGGVAIGTVTLTVEEHNFDPVAVDASFGGDEDSNISGQVSATDADGDSLYFVASGPQHGSLSFNSDGSFVYTPDANYNGSDGFDFVVEDGQGGSDIGHVDLTIAPVNDLPDLYGPRRLNTDEDTSVSGAALARDADDDKLTFELVGDGLTGLTFNKDGTWSFDPAKDPSYQALDFDQFVTVSFSYRAYDGHGYSQTVTQDIRIFGVDEPITGTSAKETINGTAIGDYVEALGGDDTVRGNGGGDQIYGGDGSDKLYGGEGNDQLSGGNGADIVNGDAGADALYGDAGADTMDGGDGDDWVYGGADNDVVKGGAGNDHVYGDAGNDDVQGGAGDDWVFGGAGADRLSGGTGADHFVFVDGDLGSTLATSDTVTDFKAIQGDVLDFSGIDADTTLAGDQGFSLVGSFGSHAGEMTVAFNAGINATVVSLDTNGDGVADYVLQLSGNVGSTAGWVL